MPSFPFFRLPFPNFYSPYYNNYTRRNKYHNFNKYDNNYLLLKNKVYKTDNNDTKKTSPKYNSFSPFDFVSNILNGNTNGPIFEIFGIELYLDDIIILGLLFILYEEGIKDEMLFLALILLLLT